MAGGHPVRAAVATIGEVVALLLAATMLAVAVRDHAAMPTWLEVAGTVVALLALTELIAATILRRRHPGLAWLTLVLVGPLLGPAHVWPGWRAIGPSLAWLLPGVALVVLGQLGGRRMSRALPTVLIGVAAASARTLWIDPFRVIACTPMCRHQPLSIGHHPGALLAARWLLGATVAWWMLDGVSATRRWIWPVAAAAAIGVPVVATADWGHAVFDLDRVPAGPVVAVAVASGSALALVGSAGRGLLARRRVRHLVAEIESGTGLGGVQDLLRRGLRDPGLTVVYPLDVPAPPPPPSGSEARTEHRVERSGTTVAVITTSTPRPLDAVLSPTVAVALENERLMVLAQAQLDELRRSREEIVARADSARRQLERDLHDGAQQRLLAISVLLGEDGSAGSAEAAATARTALDELRRIAHGLYPVVLDQFGLVEALRSLADEAPLAVELSVERGDRHRLPIEVEQLLYRCVRTVVTRAAAAGATVLEVALEAEDDHRSLGLQHDARVPVGTIDLADRVGAVGGRVTLSTVDGRQHVQVEL